MQPRTLDQINASLGSVYDPQVQSIQQQQAALPGQTAAEEQGLQAKQTQAFGDILNGARSRGTGVAFGGIPLQEQAQYTASSYLPALAQLHTAQQQHAQSLSDAINQLNAQRYKDAQSMYSNDQSLALEREKLAAAQAAASANPTFGDFGNPGGGQQPAQAADKYANVDRNGLQQSVANLIKTNNVARINQEYNAIKKSAGYGNLADQYKLELFNAAMTPNNNAPYNPATINLLKQAMNYKAPAPTHSSFSPANTARAASYSLPLLASGNPLAAVLSGIYHEFRR